MKYPEIKPPKTLGDYIKLLASRQFISQANYGDGEWSCILGLDGENSQGGIYYPELGKALRNTIMNQRLAFYGYNPGQKLVADVKAWLQKRNVNVPTVIGEAIDDGIGQVGADHHVQWVYKEIFAAANCRGELAPFISFLRQVRVLYIGPPHITAIRPHLFEFCHVPTPPQNAWNELDEMKERCMRAIQNHRPHITLVSMGMAANPLIEWLVCQRAACHIFDVGAIFDPWCGVLSRSGYKKPQFAEAMEKTTAELDGKNMIPDWSMGHADLVREYVQRAPNSGESVPYKMERTPEVLAAKQAVFDLVPTPNENEKALCIGSAEGWEIGELQKRFPKVRFEATTIFEEERQRVREHLGDEHFPIHLCDMHSFPNSWNQRYSLIFASHVLEHSPAPYIALSNMFRSMAFGGALFLVLPNADGRTHVGNKERTKRMGDMGGHIYIPSVEGLIEISRMVGFHFERYHEVLQMEGRNEAYRNRVWVFQKPMG